MVGKKWWLSLFGLLTVLVILSLSNAASVTKTKRKAPSRDRNGRPYKLVCYWGTWSVYRPDAGKFQAEDIDETLCTHLIYSFAGLGYDSKIKTLDGYLDLEENWGKGNFKKFNDLKKKVPGLTTLLAIGGWNEGSKKYSEMASSPAKRREFVQSCVKFLLKHDFDGLDFDWEYPANRGGIPEDKENFVQTLKEMREAFDEHGLLISAAVSAGKATIDTAYDVAQVSELLDFVNVMAYDFHGGWETFTGHNSPLYARPDESPEQQILNVNFSINYWIQLGAKPEKLVLGMGTYGRSFTLKNPKEHGLGAEAPSPGQAGPFTREKGTLGYNEICEMQKSQKWTVVWDDWHQAPYAYRDNQWVGYDDERSIALKVDFAKSMNLAGAMIWSIETDDFRGTCGKKYPLLNKIVEVLDGGVVVRPTFPPTTEPPPPVTDENGLTSPKPAKKECTKYGFFRDPQDCSKYFECIPSGGGQFSMINYRCSENMAFDEASKICVDRKNIPGC